MLEVLKQLVKSGPRTTEFWLALAAMAVPLLDKIVETMVGTLQQSTVVWATLAAAVISATYSVARAYLKGKGVQAIAASSSAPATPLNAIADARKTGIL